jgi:hypothetical protein
MPFWRSRLTEQNGQKVKGIVTLLLPSTLTYGTYIFSTAEVKTACQENKINSHSTLTNPSRPPSPVLACKKTCNCSPKVQHTQIQVYTARYQCSPV